MIAIGGAVEIPQSRCQEAADLQRKTRPRWAVIGVRAGRFDRGIAQKLATAVVVTAVFILVFLFAIFEALV